MKRWILGEYQVVAAINSPGFDSGMQLDKSGGHPLSSSTRQFMESRFGVDFGDVRLHSDQHAYHSASQIHAKEFTYGNHIWLVAKTS